MKAFNYISFLILTMVMLVGCKKKVQPEMAPLNENCDCATEVSAAFLMEELATPINWSGFQMQTDTDTAYAGRNVRFYALEPNANYTWYIGSEIITDQEFYRNFDASLIGQTLGMTLVIEKAANTICLPFDDGRDTITRQLTVMEEPSTADFHANNQPLFEGTFRLKDQNSSDSVDMVFDINDVAAIWHYKMTNFDGMGGEETFLSEGKNYRQLWFSSGCSFGYLHHKENGEVEFVLTVNGSSSCTPYHYIGRKLN